VKKQLNSRFRSSKQICDYTAHLKSSLIQANLETSSLNSSFVHTTLGRDMLCPKRGAGYRLILMLTIPVIALLMIVPSGILAYRVFLEQSRLDAVCETSTNQQLAGSHQAQDKHVPPLNLLFANLGLLLYAINFAIILPGSEATMIKGGALHSIVDYLLVHMPWVQLLVSH